MGAWSPIILGNDTSCEVRERFFELYDLGEEIEIIADIILEEQEENLQYDKTNVWLGLALATWECKVLTPEIFNKVKQIVDSKTDIEFHTELDADNDFLNKRQKVLEDFIKKISIEKEKARSRKKIPKQVESTYLDGMCLTYKNAEEKYIGIYLVKSEHYRFKGEITFYFMYFESVDIPNMNLYCKSKLYGLKELGEDWGNYEYQGNVVAINYEKNTKSDFYRFIPETLILIGQLNCLDIEKLSNNYEWGQMNLNDPKSVIESLETVRIKGKSENRLSNISLCELIEEIGINQILEINEKEKDNETHSNTFSKAGKKWWQKFFGSK